MLYLPCPKCNGEIETKVAKKGPRSGTEFYGCTNFPICKFTSDKIDVIDFVKNEVFTNEIPTIDSELWRDDYISSLSRKEIKFLSSLYDLPFSVEDSKHDLVRNLLSLNSFEFFNVSNEKFCFIYKIHSEFFSKFSFQNPGNIEIFNKNIVFKVFDDNNIPGGLFKVTNKAISLEFYDDYQIKYEQGNSLLLTLNLSSKAAKAMVINSTVLNNSNYLEYTYSMTITD